MKISSTKHKHYKMQENVALMIAAIKLDGYAKINHYVFPI